MTKRKELRLTDEDRAMLQIIMEKHNSENETEAIRNSMASFVGSLLRNDYNNSSLKNEMQFDEFVMHVIYKKIKEM